jgi:soluble epoxide hydrolase/lipid-phosphate phosphatase
MAQFASGELEKKLATKEELRQFVNGIFGGEGPDHALALTAEKGIDFELLKIAKPTRLLTTDVSKCEVHVFSF